jgi:hypothetical protein
MSITTKGDLLSSLPPELVARVFDFLGFDELCRAITVCPAWFNTLTAIPILWISFDPTKARFTLPQAARCLQRARGKLVRATLGEDTLVSSAPLHCDLSATVQAVSGPTLCILDVQFFQTCVRDAFCKIILASPALEQLTVRCTRDFPWFPSMSEYSKNPSSWQRGVPLQNLRTLRVHCYEDATGDLFMKHIASYAPPLESLDLVHARLRFVDPRLLPASLRHMKVDWKVLDSRCIFRLVKLPLESVHFWSLASLAQRLSAHGLSLPAENNWSRLTTLELKDYNSRDMEEFIKRLVGVGRPGPLAPIRSLTMTIPEPVGPWLSQVVEAFSATLTFIDISDPLDENLVTALSHCQCLEELRVCAKDLEVLIPFFFDSHHEFLAFYPIAQDPEILAALRATPLVPSLRRVTYPKWTYDDTCRAMREAPGAGAARPDMDVKWGCHRRYKAELIELLIIDELQRRFPFDRFPRNHCSINGVPIHPLKRLVQYDAYWGL